MPDVSGGVVDVTPASVRADAAARAPDGFIAQSGVRALKNALKGNSSAFAEWRSQPMTKLVLRALHGFLLHPPGGFMPADTLVQYGVTQGLLLAVQTMTDPSLVWPGVFGDSPGDAVKQPEMDFETSLDEVLK